MYRIYENGILRFEYQSLTKARRTCTLLKDKSFMIVKDDLSSGIIIHYEKGKEIKNGNKNSK